MSEQLLLSLIIHEVDGNVIQQRAIDGYVDATAMCKAVGKQFNDYIRIKPTIAFLDELSSETGIPVSGLIISIKGGTPSQQGTYVHPDVAINLGQWCSPKFAVAVAKWVREWMGGKLSGGKMPYHIERYIANRDQIPPTHWSMLNELTFNLIAPLEQDGYRLPENMVPDISEGRMFSKWLREQGHDPSKFPTYTHVYADGRSVRARLYPNLILADFRKHFHEVWIKTKLIEYFEERDPSALPHVEKFLLRLTDSFSVNQISN